MNHPIALHQAHHAFSSISIDSVHHTSFCLCVPEMCLITLLLKPAYKKVLTNKICTYLLLLSLILSFDLNRLVIGSELGKREEGYDCKGSLICSSFQEKFCDRAVNSLIRTEDAIYSSSRSSELGDGNCWANIHGDGCGVFIQGNDEETGEDCRISGAQIWSDYQDIRRAGCKKCGSKHYGNGCRLTINYVTKCSNNHLY